jgi:ADP-ribose pyrophosphatase YjhB (NUDIX family)
MNKQVKQHTGVYGIIVKDNKILMIKKSRGPYKGKYDLPGGTPEADENQKETLFRELSEEISCTPQKSEFFETIKDILEYTSSDDSQKIFHHTGHYYIANIHEDAPIKTDPDGHDSLGATWIKLSDIENKSVAVPHIVQKAISKYIRTLKS